MNNYKNSNNNNGRRRRHNGQRVGWVVAATMPAIPAKVLRQTDQTSGSNNNTN